MQKPLFGGFVVFQIVKQTYFERYDWSGFLATKRQAPNEGRGARHAIIAL